jgi:hypothetical protein
MAPAMPQPAPLSVPLSQIIKVLIVTWPGLMGDPMQIILQYTSTSPPFCQKPLQFLQNYIFCHLSELNVTYAFDLITPVS